MMWRGKSLTALLALTRHHKQQRERKHYKDSSCCCPLCLLVASMHMSSSSPSSSSSLQSSLALHSAFSSSSLSSYSANHLRRLSSSISRATIAMPLSMSSCQRCSKRGISSSSFDSLYVANTHHNTHKMINEASHNTITGGGDVNDVSPNNANINSSSDKKSVNSHKVDVGHSNTISTLIEPSPPSPSSSTLKRRNRRKRIKRKEKNMSKQIDESFGKEENESKYDEEMKDSHVDHSRKIISGATTTKNNDHRILENNASSQEFHGPDVELDQLLRSAERKWEEKKTSQQQESKETSYPLNTVPAHFDRVTSSHVPTTSSPLSPSSSFINSDVKLTAKTEDEVTEAVMQEAAALNLNRKMLTLEQMNTHDLSHLTHEHNETSLNRNSNIDAEHGANKTFTQLEQIERRRRKLSVSESELDVGITERLFKELRRLPALHEVHYGDAVVREVDRDIYFAQREHFNNIEEEEEELPCSSEEMEITEQGTSLSHHPYSSSTNCGHSKSKKVVNSHKTSPSAHNTNSDNESSSSMSKKKNDDIDSTEEVVELFIDDISDEELSSFNAEHSSDLLSKEANSSVHVQKKENNVNSSTSHHNSNENNDQDNIETKHEERDENKERILPLTSFPDKQESELQSNTNTSISEKGGAVTISKPLLTSPEPITHTPSFFPYIFRQSGIVQLTPLPPEDCALLLQHLLYLRGQDVKSLSRILQIKLENSLSLSTSDINNNSNVCPKDSKSLEQSPKQTHHSSQILCLQDVIHYLDHAPPPVIAFTADLHQDENQHIKLIITNQELEQEESRSESPIQKEKGKFTSPSFLFTLYVENVSVQNALAHLASLFVIPIKSFHFHTQASKMSSASLLCGVEANRLRRVHLLLVNTMRHPGYVIRISNIQEINTQMFVQDAPEISVSDLDSSTIDNNISKSSSSSNRETNMTVKVEKGTNTSVIISNKEENESEHQTNTSQSAIKDLPNYVFSSLAHWQPLYETEMLLRRISCTRREDIELRMNALTELGAIFYCSNREESMCRVATDILHGYYKSALLNALFRPQLPHSLRHFIARPNVITAAKARRVCTDANVTQLLKSFVATNGNYILTLKRTPFGWRRRWLSALRAKVWNTMAAKRIKLGGRMGAIVGDVVVKDEFKSIVHQRMITTLKAEHVKVIRSAEDATRYSLEDVFIPFLRGSYPQELFAPIHSEHPIMTESAMRTILSELHALPLLNGLSQIAQYLLDIRSSKSPLLFRRLLIRPIHMEWKLLIDKAPLRSLHYDAARLLENDRWRCEMNVLPQVALALPSSSSTSTSNGNVDSANSNNYNTLTENNVQHNQRERSHRIPPENNNSSNYHDIVGEKTESACALVPQMAILEKTSLGNCVPLGTLAEEFFKLPSLHDYVVLGQTQRQLPGQFVHASPSSSNSSNNTTSRGDVIYSLYIKSININGAIGLTQLLREYFILHGVLSESDATLQHKIHRLRREYDIETPLLTSEHYCTICYNRDHDEQSECAEYVYKREQEQRRRRAAKIIAESAQAARVIREQEKQQRAKQLSEIGKPTVSLPTRRSIIDSNKNQNNVISVAKLSMIESSTELLPSEQEERLKNQNLPKERLEASRRKSFKGSISIVHDNKKEEQQLSVIRSANSSEKPEQCVMCYMQWDLQRGNEEVAWKVQIDDKLHLYGLQDMTLLVDGKVWITWMSAKSQNPQFITPDQLKSLCQHEEEFLAQDTSTNNAAPSQSSLSSASPENEEEEKGKESFCENIMIRSLTTLFDQIAQASPPQRMYGYKNNSVINNNINGSSTTTTMNDQVAHTMSFDGVTAEVLTSLFETKIVKTNSSSSSSNNVADGHNTSGSITNVSCYNAFKLERCNWVLTEVNSRIINSQADVAAVFLESKHDRQLSLLFSSKIDIQHKPDEAEWNVVRNMKSINNDKQLEQEKHHQRQTGENASMVHRIALLPLSLPRLSEAVNVLSMIAKQWIRQLPAKLTLTLSRSLLELCTSHASWGIQLHHSDLTLTNLNLFMQLYWLDPLTNENKNVDRTDESSKADRFVKKQSEKDAKSTHYVHVTAIQPAELFILPSYCHQEINNSNNNNVICANNKQEIMQKIMNEASSILNSMYKLHRINGNVVHSVQDVLNYMKGWTQRHEAIIHNNTAHVNRNKNKFAAIQARMNLTLERKVNVQVNEILNSSFDDAKKLLLQVTYRANDNEGSDTAIDNNSKFITTQSTTITEVNKEVTSPQRKTEREQESHEKSISTELMVSTKPIKLLTPMQQRTSTFTLVVERRIVNRATRYKWGITVEAHSRLLKSVQHDELYYSSVYAADRAKGQRILDNLRYFSAERMRTQIEGNNDSKQQNRQALPKTPAYSSFRLFAYLIIGVNNKPVHTYRILRAALTQMYVNSTLNTASSELQANLSDSQRKELLQASMEQESIVLQVRQVKFLQLALTIKRGEDESGAMRPVGLTLHQKDLYITNVLADSPVAHAIESATHNHCSIRLLIKQKKEQEEAEQEEEEEERTQSHNDSMKNNKKNNNKTKMKNSHANANSKEHVPVILISSLASAMQKLKNVVFPENDINSLSPLNAPTRTRKWKYELDEDEENVDDDKDENESETEIVPSFLSRYKKALNNLAELTNNLYKQFMELSMVDAVQFAQVMRLQEFCDVLQQHLNELESILTAQTVDYSGNDESLCDDMQSVLSEKWQTEYVQLQKQLTEIEENVRWKVIYAIHAKQMLRTSADVALALAPGVMEETIIVQQGFDIYNEDIKQLK